MTTLRAMLEKSDELYGYDAITRLHLDMARCQPSPPCPDQAACARANQHDDGEFRIVVMNASPYREWNGCPWFISMVREAA